MKGEKQAATAHTVPAAIYMGSESLSLSLSLSLLSHDQRGKTSARTPGKQIQRRHQSLTKCITSGTQVAAEALLLLLLLGVGARGRVCASTTRCVSTDLSLCVCVCMHVWPELRPSSRVEWSERASDVDGDGCGAGVCVAAT